MHHMQVGNSIASSTPPQTAPLNASPLPCQVPLVIVDLLVFVVYALDRTNIEARMGVVITLVSPLAAFHTLRPAA